MKRTMLKTAVAAIAAATVSSVLADRTYDAPGTTKFTSAETESGYVKIESSSGAFDSDWQVWTTDGTEGAGLTLPKNCHSLSVAWGNGLTGRLKIEDGLYSFNQADAINGNHKWSPFFIGVLGGVGYYWQTGGSVTATDNAVVIGGSGDANQRGVGSFRLEGGSFVNTSSDTIVGYGYGSGAFEMTGGTFETKGIFQIVEGPGSDCSASVSGGEFTVGTILDVGHGNANCGVGTFTASGDAVVKAQTLNVGSGATAGRCMVSGGTITLTDNNSGNGALQLGKGSTSYGELIQSGGTISVPQNCWASVGHSGSGESSYTMTGGTFDMYADGNNGAFVVGRNDTTVGTLSVSGTGSFSTRRIILGEKSGATGTLNLGTGGSVAVKYFENTGTGVINLAGGTLKALATHDNFIPAKDGLTVNVKAGGAVIDTQAYNITINEPLLSGVEAGETDGGLVKKGSGTLTLTAPASYNGPTRVEGGTLAAGTALNASAEIVLAGGLITTSDVTFDEVTVVSGLCRSDVPATKVILAGGQYAYDASAEENLEVGSKIRFASSKLVAADGYTLVGNVSIYGAPFDWTYEMVDGELVATAGEPSGDNEWVGGASGNFGDGLNWRYGIPLSGKTAKISADASIVLNATYDAGTLVLENDCLVEFIRGAGDKIHVQKITGEGSVIMNYAGLSCIGAQTADIEVNVEMVNGAWFGDHLYNGTMNISGDISGSGTLGIWGRGLVYNFSGDNSRFTGNVRRYNENDTIDIKFLAPESGFSNATDFWYKGSLFLSFAEGTITFGGMTLTSRNGARSINLIADAATGSGVVMVVGNNDADVSMYHEGDYPYQAYVYDNGWIEGCDKFTIRKVGTGTFTEDMIGTYNLDCVGGTTTLANDSTTVAVTVRDGATLKVAEDHTVGSVAFESGAKFVSTVTETTEDDVTVSSAACLTASGAIAFSDTVISTDGATPDTSVRYPVISAASLSGSIAADIEDPVTTDRFVWLAKRSPTAVFLRYSPLNPGLFIIIR